MMKRKILFFNNILTLLLFFLILSCESGTEDLVLELPQTPILNVENYWAVVDFGFLNVRKEPLEAAPMVTMLRQGTIVEILSSNPQVVNIEGKSGRWYEIQHSGTRGWVFGPYLQIFDSIEKARNASRGF